MASRRQQAPAVDPAGSPVHPAGPVVRCVGTFSSTAQAQQGVGSASAAADHTHAPGAASSSWGCTQGCGFARQEEEQA